MSNTTVTKYVGSHGQVYRTVVKEEEGAVGALCKVVGAITLCALISAALSSETK